MSGQSYNLQFNIDVAARAGSIRNLTREIQAELDRLKLPVTQNKAFNSQFAIVAKELNEIERLSQKTSLSMGDVSKADKSWSSLTAAIERMKVILRSLGTDGVGAEQAINNLIDPNVIDKFGQLEEAVKKADAALKGYNNSKESQNLQQQIKNEEEKRKALEKEAKALKLNAKERKAIDAKNSVFGLVSKDSSAETEAQKIKDLITLTEQLAQARQNVTNVRKQKNSLLPEDYKQQLQQAEEARDKILKTFNTTYGTNLVGQGSKGTDENLLRQIEIYKQYANELNSIEEKLNNFNQKTAAVDAASGKIQQIQTSLSSLGKNNEAKTLDELAMSIAKITGVNANELPRNFEQLQQIVSNFKTNNIQQVVSTIENMESKLGGATAQTQQLGTSMNTTADEVRKMTAASRDMDQLKSRMQYFFSLTGITQTLRRAFRDVTNTVKELDKVMTETAVVTDFTISDMWDKLPEYTSKASELGTSIASLYEATTLYYQQGLGDAEAMSIGVETMKMARIASMDATDATKAMTAALRGFNMEINEMSAARVNDVYSELAAITAADTSQIATAMSKTASIASSANMEFETTAAFLAQIIETTQEAPETAGTAMKTIIARFTEVKKLYSEGMLTGKDGEGEAIEINKIDAALQSVGISLKDFLLGKQGIDDIFLELAQKWDTLDLATQRYIATTAAGSRQQSRFIAMMSDYDRTMELVGAANNSAGASQEQFSKTLDSLDSKMERLKNAWHEFALGIVDNDIIKGGIDLLTKLLETINKLTNSLGKAGPLARIGLIAGGFRMGRGLFNKSGTGSMFQAAGAALRSKAGLAEKVVTQTFGQTLATKAKTSIAGSSWLQKYLVADSVFDRVRRKALIPPTGKNAPQANPLYQKISDYFTRRKQFKPSNSKEILDLQEEINYVKTLPNTPRNRKIEENLRSRLNSEQMLAEEQRLAFVRKPWAKAHELGKSGGYMAIGGIIASAIGDAMEGAGAAQGKEGLEAWGSGIKAAGATAAALGTVSTALTAFGLAIPGANIIIAATAALVGLYKGLEKAAYLKSDEHALEVAKANKEVAEKTAKQEQERLKTTKTLTQDLGERYAKIDNMSKGSAEWKIAVAELNTEIAEAISQVPELAAVFKMEEGMLKADLNKLDQVTEAVERQAIIAETNLTIADHEETTAENNLESSDIYDKLFGNKMTKKWMDDGTKRSILERLLKAYEEGQLKDLSDVRAYTGVDANTGIDFNDIVIGLMQYSGNQAETQASQVTLNQQMIEGAKTMGTISEDQATTLSGLSETFLDEMYADSEKAAKENMDMRWNSRERRRNRKAYAEENDLTYRHGFWGLWSGYRDADGNKVKGITDTEIRSEELNTKTQQQYGQQAQSLATLIRKNPELGRLMSADGGDMGQTDLDFMSEMFVQSEDGEVAFDAEKFAKRYNYESAEAMAAEFGFEGKEAEFFGQIAKNFQSKLEDNIERAFKTIELGNALDLSKTAMDALDSEEYQQKAIDLYDQMSLRGLDQKAMKATMEVFGQFAEKDDLHGMEELSKLVDEINFNNPIEAFGQLQKAAERGSYIEKQYASAILESGSTMIGTGAQLQYFLRSEDFDSVWKELEGIVELNETIEPKDVLELAESHEVLSDLMEQTGLSATGLAKAIELIGSGAMSVDSMTDAVVAAFSAMSTVEDQIARGLQDASKFDPGQDENQAAGFLSQAHGVLKGNIEKGAWGNSQNAEYLNYLFGDNWRSDDAETQASNMKTYTKFLEDNSENMSNAWKMAAQGKTAGGGQGNLDELLGLTLDEATGKITFGAEAYNMSSEEIVRSIQDGFGVSENMARLMLADFKNYSKDFDLLLNIAQRDEEEGAKRFKTTIEQRAENNSLEGYKGMVDKAELQTTALGFGYVDNEDKAAWEQYAEKHGITSDNGYLITDYYYEDGSRKGGTDLSRAFGAAVRGEEVAKQGTTQAAAQERAIADEFFDPHTLHTTTGTWAEYIGAGDPFEQQERLAEFNAIQAAAAEAEALLGEGLNASSGIRIAGTDQFLSWQQYLNTKVGDDEAYDQAYAEYEAWVRSQENAIQKRDEAPSWIEAGLQEFDYSGMTEYLETLGATNEEAAAIAQSQINAKMEAEGITKANLKMWSDTLGKEIDVEHQKGENLQKEFQRIEAEERRQAEIATLREALGIGEDGILKVTFDGLDQDGQISTVFFDPDEASAQAVKDAVSQAECKVTFSGSGAIEGSGDGTFHMSLSAHKSGLVDSPSTHEALLGEEGPELVQTKNGAWIAGLNGPEVGIVNKGDTVYTAEQTEQIFNPKKNSMPRFEPGFNNDVDVGPGGYDTITTSGGKTAGKDNEWENPYDKLYNLVRKIDEELRVRERLERRYEKLLEDLGTSANQIIAISQDQLTQLEYERQLQEELISQRGDDIVKYQEENEDLLKYASMTQNENGDWELRIDWEAIDAVTDKEKGAEIEAYVGQLEEWYDSITEAEDALVDIEEAVQEIKERGEDEYFDLEGQIKDALEKSYQDEIDKLENINDSINDTNAELLDGIQKTIDRQRQDRENAKTEEDLADKQRRLSYLQMDTSGANATEILKLQKEIEEGQEDYTDTLIDQKISELQEQNDEAAKQREKQIDLLQAQLDHYIQSGEVWNDVYRLMDEGLNGDDGLVTGSELADLLQNEAGFEGMSVLEKMKWLEETNDLIAQGLSYLQIGRQVGNLELEDQTIEFYTADGHKVTGTVGEDGVVTTADGVKYEEVYQGYNGQYYTGENFKTPEATSEDEGAESGTESSGDGSGTESGSGSENGSEWAPPLKKQETVMYRKYYFDEAKKEIAFNFDTFTFEYTEGEEGIAQKKLNMVNKKQDESMAIAQAAQRAWSSKNKPKTPATGKTPVALEKFATGGLADFTGPAWLDGTKSRPEMVLNARDTQNFIELKDILSSVLSNNFGNSTSTENNGDITYDIDINVESMSSDYDVDKVATRVKTLIAEDARYRNNNAVSLTR